MASSENSSRSPTRTPLPSATETTPLAAPARTEPGVSAARIGWSRLSGAGAWPRFCVIDLGVGAMPHADERALDGLAAAKAARRGLRVVS